jgi:hypothetical protein
MRIENQANILNVSDVLNTEVAHVLTPDSFGSQLLHRTAGVLVLCACAGGNCGERLLCAG